MEHQVCKKCEVSKPLSEFYPDRSLKLGVISTCKKCHAENRKKYRAENKEELKKKEKERAVQLKTVRKNQIQRGAEARCKTCGESKSITEFYFSGATAGAHNPNCKDCEKSRNKAYIEYAAKRTPKSATKVCTKCGEEKDLVTGFYKNNSSKTGYLSACKDCHKGTTKKSYNKHVSGNKGRLEKRNEGKKNWYDNNIKDNPEKLVEKSKRNKEWYKSLEEKDPELLERIRAKGRVENMTPEQHEAKKARDVAYGKTEKGKATKRKAHKKERSTPRGKIRHAVSSCMRLRLQKRAELGTKYVKGGKSAFDKIAGKGLLPYTVEELMDHLEAKFLPGMSWANYGNPEDGSKGWHVDHVIADVHFEYETYTDPGFLECWSLANLQPLWGEDNLSKGCKLDWEFNLT